MKKPKAKTKKVYKTCDGCGAQVSPGQGIQADGKFYCDEYCR
jgi:hypothetical protein